MNKKKEKSNYRLPINFTTTGNYGSGLEGEDDVYTIKEFLRYCKTGMFTDYDGFGNPVKDKMCDPSIEIKPSRLSEIPEDATHIVWYNR